MRSLLIGAAAILGATAFAYAGDDVMANYYGNTVIGKSAMGESHVQYSADHTFAGTASSPMGSMALKGTWAVNDKGELCRTYDNPPPGMTNPLCTAWAAHKVGDSWTVAPGRTATLVQGKQ